jgi:hypothetical protein
MTATNTPFVKENFNYSGGYLTYGKLFIARFKYGKSPITKAKFLKELLKSGITVEQYEEASKKQAPVTILDSNNPNWSKDICDAWIEKQEAKSQARFR